MLRLSASQYAKFRATLKFAVASKQHTVTSLAKTCCVHRTSVHKWLSGKCKFGPSKTVAIECFSLLGAPSLEVVVPRKGRVVPTKLSELLQSKIYNLAHARSLGIPKQARTTQFSEVGIIVSDILRLRKIPHRLVIDHNKLPDTAIEIWFDLPNYLNTVWCIFMLDSPSGLLYELIQPDLPGAPRQQYGEFNKSALSALVQLISKTAKTHLKIVELETARELKQKMQQQINKRI